MALDAGSFQAHLSDRGLLDKGDRILVGYSGGADSTALLHLLTGLGYDVVAGHLHHGQRQEADEEQEKCRVFAESLGAVFLSGRADVPMLSKRQKIGLEEAGRHARYAFFAKAAAELQAAWIATAHTRDDTVETVLLNLARGSGLAGLGGIPERRDNVVRPLLAFSREETRNYCVRHGLWFHDDPANSDVAFSRSRIRLRVLPELREINNAFDANLARFSQIAREEDAFLDALAARHLEQCEADRNGDLSFMSRDLELYFDASSLCHAPKPLLARAVRLASRALGGALTLKETDLVVEGLLQRSAGAITATEGKLVLEWTADILHCRRLDGEVMVERFAIPSDGEVNSTFFNWKLNVGQARAQGEPSPRAGLRAEVDGSRVRLPLHLRGPDAGEKMTPLGGTGRRKISDLLSEAKLSQIVRKRLPLVCDFLGPIWLPGVCIEQRVAIDSPTDNVLVLEFGPADTE